MPTFMGTSSIIDHIRAVPTAPAGRSTIDEVRGDAELAAMLDSVRNLVEADSLSMYVVTETGELGSLLAGVGADMCARACQNDGVRFDRILSGASMTGGLWLPGGPTESPVHVSPLPARGQDRLVLISRPLVVNMAGRRALERQIARYLPLIERTVAQWARAHRELLQRREHQAVFDLFGFGLLVIDAECRIRTANTTARAMLAESKVVSDHGDRLTIARMDGAMRFQVMLHHALETVDDHDAPIIAPIERANTMPLLLVVQAIPRRGTAGLALIQMIDPAAELALPLTALARHYGLTPVEQRLTEQLVHGRTLGEAAAVMRLKEQTARTYLKHIFQKTGLRRQVELVRMVLAGAVPRIATS